MSRAERKVLMRGLSIVAAMAAMVGVGFVLLLLLPHDRQPIALAVPGVVAAAGVLRGEWRDAVRREEQRP